MGLLVLVLWMIPGPPLISWLYFHYFGMLIIFSWSGRLSMRALELGPVLSIWMMLKSINPVHIILFLAYLVTWLLVFVTGPLCPFFYFWYVSGSVFPFSENLYICACLDTCLNFVLSWVVRVHYVWWCKKIILFWFCWLFPIYRWYYGISCFYCCRLCVLSSSMVIWWYRYFLVLSEDVFVDGYPSHWGGLGFRVGWQYLILSEWGGGVYMVAVHTLFRLVAGIIYLQGCTM